MPNCPVRESFDPLSAEFLCDPFAVRQALPLDDEPVFHAPSLDYYVVTRHADVEYVFPAPGAVLGGERAATADRAGA